MHFSMFLFLLWGTGMTLVSPPPFMEGTFLLPSPTGMTATRALNLHGPVMAVSTEKALFTNGKEDKRRPDNLFTFDTQGYLTENTIYSPATKFTCLNTYDAQGRLSTQECTIADARAEGKTVISYAFTYDAQGRLTVQRMTIRMNDEKSLGITETCTLDDAGRIHTQFVKVPEGTAEDHNRRSAIPTKRPKRP